ncbi:hypothetical protein LCGC14_2450950 [marine sediment metagenome]|uniref:Myb-like domain-containing protein n=1 Tax=marine sediment metagenome TaxID=412755 RepID=A0A0F9DT89_9ZZZZ
METKDGRKGSGWTKEEVRTLKSVFRNNSNVAVAVILERTTKAIERKAAKLNLTKTKKYLRGLGKK